MKTTVLPAVVSLTVFLTSGCAPEDGLYFQDPKPGDDPQVVRLGTSSNVDSVRTVASTLRSNGFMVTREEPSSGIVEATADGAAFVDCGIITQYALGNRAEFAGSSPSAVIFLGGETAEFVLRRVSASTATRIMIQDSVANVTESHDVTMSWSDPEGNVTSTDRRWVRPGEPTRFKDNTACVTSDRVANLLR